jgi:hypothetical protein
MSMTFSGESAIAAGGTARIAVNKNPRSANNTDRVVAVNMSVIPL